MQLRKPTFLLTLIFLSFSLLLPAQNRTKKALFIIVDGIPADVLEKVNTPHLDRITRTGHYLRAHVGGDTGTYSETPTISAVGYNSLLTGTWVNKHNVPDNDIKTPNYHYPTIFRLLKDQFPSKKTAIFSSWTDNRTKLIGEGLPQTGNLMLDYHADGYELDTIRFPHDKGRDFMHRIDEQVTQAAVSCLKTQAPDLSWVYLEYTDDMGHLYGDSPQFYQAVEKMDDQVGRIWEAVQYRQRNFKEDWLVVITTDHGRDEQTGRNHGDQTPRQRTTWIVTNAPALNAYAQQNNPGIVDIMPTLARHLGIRLPQGVAREVDGVPLVGPVSLANPKVNYNQGKLDVSWQALEPKGKVKVWIASTNLFKEGSQDAYQLLAEVPLTEEHVLLDVQHMPSSFYKVVLEGHANTVNRWVVPIQSK